MVYSFGMMVKRFRFRSEGLGLRVIGSRCRA
jgi:hypothetical protein